MAQQLTMLVVVIFLFGYSTAAPKPLDFDEMVSVKLCCCLFKFISDYMYHKNLYFQNLCVVIDLKLILASIFVLNIKKIQQIIKTEKKM